MIAGMTCITNTNEKSISTHICFITIQKIMHKNATIHVMRGTNKQKTRKKKSSHLLQKGKKESQRYNINFYMNICSEKHSVVDIPLQQLNTGRQQLELWCRRCDRHLTEAMMTAEITEVTWLRSKINKLTTSLCSSPVAYIASIYHHITITYWRFFPNHIPNSKKQFFSFFKLHSSVLNKKMFGNLQF